jgi:hypothetical protein
MNHPWDRCAGRWTYLILITAAALGILGCFHRGGMGKDNSWITEAEIDSVHAITAYDAVKRLRPQFLENHGSLSLNPRDPPSLPNVYVDNQYYGDITALRSISATAVEAIKFYNASEAQYAFGRGNMAGVISILTKH